MNYLGHLLLCDAHPQHQLGQLAADSIKGSLALQSLAPAVAQGVRMHRAIDAAADQTYARLELWRLFTPSSRRYHAIFCDLALDYILANDWPRGDFILFCAQVEDHLWSERPHWPAGFERLGLHLSQGQDLREWRQWSRVEYALTRLGQRLRAPNPLAGASQELKAAVPALTALLPSILAGVDPQHAFTMPAAGR